MPTPGVLGPQDVVARLTSRLRDAPAFVTGTRTWHPRIRLGTGSFSGSVLRAAWPTLQLDALEWRDWEETAPPGVRLRWRSVSYDRSPQELPAVVEVDDLEAAAAVLDGGHPADVRGLRERWRRLIEEFPEARDTARVLTAAGRWPERDFDLLCGAAAFLREPQQAVLTTRQVPVSGMDTKWLRKRLPWVARLAGMRTEELPVTTRRPGRVHFTYLDPNHLRAGGRRYDLATEGDRAEVAYRPHTVVICENRDVAQLFPAVPQGIAIEGDGTGPGLIAALPWVREAHQVCYWGDMDVRGLEILSGFRRAGLTVRSLLMDLSAYERWEEQGVDHDADGRRIAGHVPREVVLTDAERELYLALCADDWTRPRRIEQERIDLSEAWSLVMSEAAR